MISSKLILSVLMIVSVSSTGVEVVAVGGIAAVSLIYGIYITGRAIHRRYSGVKPQGIDQFLQRASEARITAHESRGVCFDIVRKFCEGKTKTMTSALELARSEVNANFLQPESQGSQGCEGRVVEEIEKNNAMLIKAYEECPNKVTCLDAIQQLLIESEKLLAEREAFDYAQFEQGELSKTNSFLWRKHSRCRNLKSLLYVIDGIEITPKRGHLEGREFYNYYATFEKAIKMNEELVKSKWALESRQKLEEVKWSEKTWKEKVDYVRSTFE